MTKRNRFLFFIAFTSGFCIMAMEMSASRMMAPFFGTSQIVWTNIIGIVLIALSLGYFFGGKFADKHPSLPFLLYPMLFAGLFYSVIPWIIQPFSKWTLQNASLFASGAHLLVIGSFLATLILFALPIFLLGMVSPFVIRLLETDQAHLGRLSGIVFSVGTIGSILGTFLPTLFLIPQFGTKITVSLVAGILVFISAFPLLKKKSMLVFIPVISLINFIPITQASGIIFAKDSVYQYIRVKEYDDGSRRLIFNEGLGVQSVYDPTTILSGEYYDAFFALAEKGDDVLILGLAGGTIARGLHALHGGDIRIVGVEIDAVVAEVAKRHFDLPDEVEMHIADARHFVQTDSQTYDLIVVDAYSQELYIPWTMATQEFFSSVHNRLNDGGIVALNINATTEDAKLISIMENTLASVFAYSEKVPLTQNGSFNYLLIASQKPIILPPVSDFRIAPIVKQIEENRRFITYNQKERIFTDDWAPVERFTDKMIIDFFRDR